MGLGVIIQGAALAFSVIQGVKANKASKEASAISTASEKLTNKRNARRALREKRFKEAQILQAGENLGFSGSSMALGAQSALAANLANNIALQTQTQITKEGLTSQNQIIADAASATKTVNAFAGLLETSIDAFGE